MQRVQIDAKLIKTTQTNSAQNHAKQCNAQRSNAKQRHAQQCKAVKAMRSNAKHYKAPAKQHHAVHNKTKQPKAKQSQAQREAATHLPVKLCRPCRCLCIYMRRETFNLASGTRFIECQINWTLPKKASHHRARTLAYGLSWTASPTAGFNGAPSGNL